MPKVYTGSKNVYFLALLHKILKKERRFSMKLWHSVFLTPFLILCLIASNLFSYISVNTVSASSPSLTDTLQETSLYAKSALLMDASNGRVLYEKNGYEKLPMASTTKIMTCIYTIEHGNLDDLVTISDHAARQPKVRLGVRQGEQYRLKDLLYALMLESYNDCAVAIAEHMSGSVEQFCYDISNKARDLGAYDTNFETPNGLDSDKHYTTSYDLALITKYAIQNETFLTIVKQQMYQFEEQTKKTSHFLSNKDAFLTQYNGAFGVKTGFTGNAGYCFVGAAKREEKTMISVVLASGWPPNKTWKWSDTKKLMNYGFEHFSFQEIGTDHLNLPSIPVNNGQKNSVILYTDAKKETLLLSPSETFDIKIQLPDTLDAPIIKDMPLGSITYYLNGTEFRCYSIYAKHSVLKIDYRYCFYKVIKYWLSF